MLITKRTYKKKYVIGVLVSSDQLETFWRECVRVMRQSNERRQLFMQEKLQRKILE